MNMRWSYGREKIGLALDTLVNWEGSRREGLAEAYISHLIHLREENVPIEVWEELESMKVDMRQVEDTQIGSVKASLPKVSDDRLKEHLSNIAYWPFKFCEE